MFRYTTTVKIYDTDASGALFFIAQFRLVHDACEAFLATTGLFVQGKLVPQLPIVHAEADYAAPLRWGDQIVVEIEPGKIGKTSFGLRYRLVKSDGTVAGTVSTVHVAISGRTCRPVRIPAKLRAALTAAGAPRRKAG
jgi:YbgC/YbaW family acyl-CoA thioester hydrolase